MPGTSPPAIGSLWLYLASEWHYLVNLSLYVIYGVFFTILAVTSHRVIIRGAESVPAYGLKRWFHREFGFFGWILAVYLVYLMVWMLPATVMFAITANLAGSGTEYS